MEELEYTGKRFVTDLLIKKQENGWWTATYVVRHFRSEDMDTWEEADIEASATAETDIEAVKQATTTLVAYMQSLNGKDLFDVVNTVDKSRLN